MLRVIAVMPRDKYEPTKLLMDELPVAALSALHTDETCVLQIGNQLANLAWHTANFITLKPVLLVLTSNRALCPAESLLIQSDIVLRKKSLNQGSASAQNTFSSPLQL